MPLRRRREPDQQLSHAVERAAASSREPKFHFHSRRPSRVVTKARVLVSHTSSLAAWTDPSLKGLMCIVPSAMILVFGPHAAFTNFFLSSSRFPHDLTKRILSRGVEGKEKGASRALRRLRTAAVPKRRTNVYEKTRVDWMAK